MKWLCHSFLLVLLMVLLYTVPGNSAQDMDGDYVPETPETTPAATPTPMTEETQKKATEEAKKAEGTATYLEQKKLLENKEGINLTRPIDTRQTMTEAQRKIQDAGREMISQHGTISAAASNMMDPNNLTKPTYDPLTNDGSLGCAQIAAEVLAKAGILPSSSYKGKKILSITTFEQMFKDEKTTWKKVTIPPDRYQVGDLVKWPGPSGKGESGRHIGVVMEHGANPAVLNNDSGNKRVKISTADHRKVEWVYRRT
jgi:hypothetical protein